MSKPAVLLSNGAGLLALAILLPHLAAAAWPTDPLVNVPLCTTGANGIWVGNDFWRGSKIVSDGVGGAIVVWYGGAGIFAQRISADGMTQWPTSGVAIFSGTLAATGSTTIEPDGTGGAIIAWQTGGIFAQRISADGTLQWALGGVRLSTPNSNAMTRQPTSVSDGAGGAIVIWEDARFDPVLNRTAIYAQRISAGGEIQWASGGVAACIPPAAHVERYAAAAPDGAGGALIAWDDEYGNYPDIYSQRISATGVPLWGANGVATCVDSLVKQQLPNIISDGAGGAIVSWSDYRNRITTSVDIYAQRISADGTPQWPTNGVAVCNAPGVQQYPAMVPDGLGGAIVTWDDNNGSSPDGVYAQRISASGTTQWQTRGVPLSLTLYTWTSAEMVPDGAGGAIITWVDIRDPQHYGDIYAQRLSADGTFVWDGSDVALCTAASDQTVPVIVTDGVGGAVVAWTDYRGGSYWGVYAQRVQANGQLGGAAWVDVPHEASHALALGAVGPNPSRGGTLNVRFALASSAAATIELLDLAGRRLTALDVGTLGPGQHTTGLTLGQHLAPGLYFVRLQQGVSTRVARVTMLR